MAGDASVSSIYRLTSIARPVDPSYPTNLALLIVLPIGAAGLAALAHAGIVAASPLSAAVSALMTGFASWALTRELSPDDDAAAFLALLLAWTMMALTGTSGVLLIFALLLLVRIVNRSTGLAARPWDTLVVSLFALWASWQLAQPLLALVAAAAFVADALFEDGARLNFAAGGLCAGYAAWRLFGDGIEPVSGSWGVPILVLLGCAGVAAAMRTPLSRCDVSCRTLALPRVRLGLAVGGLAGLQSLLHGVPWTGSLVWASLAAVPVSAAARALGTGRPAAT